MGRNLLLALLVSGCATVSPNQAKITFSSNPAGAVLSTQKQVFGQMPKALIWTLQSAQNGALSEPVTATWPSGAKTTVQMNLSGGLDGVYTLQRDMNAPGLQQDLAVERQIQQTAAAQNTAAAISILGAAAAYQEGRAMAGPPVDLGRPYPESKPTRIPDYHCEKSVLGNSSTCSAR